METSLLVKAIRKLKPAAEFSFVEEDYSTIKWDSLDGDAPTRAEINAAIESIKLEEAAQEAAQEAAKQAAQAKLELLGLTADDLKALGL
jgi:hypothetical protein